MRSIVLFGFFLLSTIFCLAQNEQNVQLSGLVMQYDSIKPIPYANISVYHSKTGVIADQMGLFSIKVKRNDTLVFSAVGRKTSYYVVPDTLSAASYSIILKMPKDTIQLKTVQINSWPSIDQFNRAFSKEHGFDKKYPIAQKNSTPDMNNIDQFEDIRMNDYFELNGDKYMYMYENAHIPLNHVLNPKNWDKLVDEWKRASR